MLLWGVAGGGWGGGAGNRIDRCRAPQEKLHGIRVVVTGCLAQRRTPVGLSLVDRGCFSDAYAAAAWRPLWP